MRDDTSHDLAPYLGQALPFDRLDMLSGWRRIGGNMSGDSTAALWITLWLLGAGVSVALYIWSRRYKQLSPRAAQFRFLMLAGILPCGGFNIVFSLAFFVIFMVSARKPYNPPLAGAAGHPPAPPLGQQPGVPSPVSPQTGSATQSGAHMPTSPAPHVDPGYVRLPEGRKFQTPLPLDEAISTLTRAIGGYRQQPYPDMPYLSFPRFAWNGVGAAPDLVAAFEGQDGPRFVPLWHGESGTAAGMCSLDGELVLSEIGRWHAAGGKLTSVGTFSAGSLSLGGPQLLPGYFEDILQIAGYPSQSERNLSLLNHQVKQMFLTKAWQFITLDGQQNQKAADQFRERWASSSAQQILDALAALGPDMPQQLWDLPERVRGIVLQARHNQGTFWDEFER